MRLTSTIQCLLLCASVVTVASCGEFTKEAAKTATASNPISQVSHELKLKPASTTYELVALTEPAPFRGIHGLTFTNDDQLLVGSVLGANTFAVDHETGAYEEFMPPMIGMADDLEMNSDGTLVWTAFLLGQVYAQGPEDDAPRLIADGFMGANSTAFKQDGRSFFTQVFLGDALYELDITGENPPRKIIENMGGLNGFDFGPDGKLYGPIWFKQQIARVDVDTGDLEVIAEGFGTPAAVNFNSKGELYMVDTKLGEVRQVNIEDGTSRLVSKTKPSLDNLAFNEEDRLFVTNMADNAIIEIDTETGEQREIISSKFVAGGEVAMGPEGEIIVADVFSLRAYNPENGAIHDIARMYSDELENPLSITIANGKTVVTNWSAGAVQILDANTGESDIIAHDFMGVTDGIIGPDGALYYLDWFKNGLYRATGDHLENRELIASDLEGPAAIIEDGKGGFVVSENKAGRITSIALETGEREVLISGLNQPEGMAWKDENHLIIAEVGAGRIIAVNTSDGEGSVLKNELPIGTPGFPGGPSTNVITGVVPLADGSIVFGSDVDAALYQLKPQ